ncbi:MAG: trypsin-like serine protease [Clostridiales bacterium]|jgi:serine protease Do|nr:trypsin-like serine protease [Clostridiales bacterium]
MSDEYERKDTPDFPDERSEEDLAQNQQETGGPPQAGFEEAPEYTGASETPQTGEAPQPGETPQTGEIPQAGETPQAEQHASAPYPNYSSGGAYSQPYGSYPHGGAYGAGGAYGRPGGNAYGADGQPYGGYRQYDGQQTSAPQYSPYGRQPYGGAQYGGQAPVPPTTKKGNKGVKVFFSLLAAFVILGAVFAFVAHYGSNESDISTNTTEAGNVNAPVVETQSSPSSDDSGDSAAAQMTPVRIAATVKPWVVGVVVYSNASGSATSEGSGILWKEDTGGYTYIITCAHVISGSGLSYTIQTEDGTQYDAERVGYDTKTDLGVLKIKKTGLSLAKFGDSGTLRVGDAIYAVGNPGGTEFFGSFTSGVVSAIDRSVKSRYTMVCIQHDAAINPGNSGGALVNGYGQVIGINSLKIIDTQYEGMGFAIPIKSAQQVINSLAQHGYVPDRPKLGITYAEAINYQQYSMIVKIKGLPSGSLIITEIGEDSDLSNTDAKLYDMIIAVDGEELTKSEVLIDKIEKSKIGDKLKLTLCRIDNNYKITQFDVTVRLVEDKGVVEGETTTTSPFINPYDFFNDLF